jgi:hypothetical protein
LAIKSFFAAKVAEKISLVLFLVVSPKSDEDGFLKELVALEDMAVIHMCWLPLHSVVLLECIYNYQVLELLWLQNCCNNFKTATGIYIK